MDPKVEKCVIIVDENLPLGLIANTASILGTTLGMKRPDVIGNDVVDMDGNSHMGIVTMPVAILKADEAKIHEIRQKLFEPEFEEVMVVDFTDAAMSCMTYDHYTAKISSTPESQLQYRGILICGNKKLVNKVAGSLPLLR